MADLLKVLLDEGNSNQSRAGTDQNRDKHQTNHTVVIVVKLHKMTG